VLDRRAVDRCGVVRAGCSRCLGSGPSCPLLRWRDGHQPRGQASARPEDAAEQLLAPGSLVLVTGASGYIGARLVPELLDAGYRVRCLVRTPAKIEHAEWLDRVQIVAGDVEGDLTEALEGVDAAYYLIHAIGASPDWVERDRRSARTSPGGGQGEDLAHRLPRGARGGEGGPAPLRPPGQPPRSGCGPRWRQRQGHRAASGSRHRAGSASFEMLRYLVEVLPVMITPRWVDTRCQPIAIGDLLRCLLAVLGRGDTAGARSSSGAPTSSPTER